VSAVTAPWLDRASAEVEAVSALLNATNLFPVPDADTGTNMLLTLKAAARGAASDGIAGAARAALMEAAGNSGVILSEILRGISGGLGDGWASAWIAGDAAAQAAVTTAQPGTILSVSAAVARAASEHSGTDAELAASIWAAARAAALDTAAHPPIPSALGTVDAGAHGLERVVAAFAAVVAGTECTPLPVSAPTACVATGGPTTEALYEVMYLLEECSAESAAALRSALEGLGDSVLVVGDADLWSVHVHLVDPGAAVEAGIRHGRPRRIRITPLATEAVARTLIVVSNGPGLTEILRTAGARVIDASGGRRPEAVEFIAAGRDVREVVLLPHDRRSLAAAVDAVEALRLAGVRVAVLPTKSTVQVLAALAVHDASRSFDDDLVAMTAAAGQTRYATMATALRDGLTSAGPCRAGDLLGMINGDVSVIGSDLGTVSIDVVDRLLASGGELLTLVTGADAPPEVADAVVAHAKQSHPEIEVQVIDGGQHFYPLLIGLE
jgi:DAK2 domain fusion protein YloV